MGGWVGGCVKQRPAKRVILTCSSSTLRNVHAYMDYYIKNLGSLSNLPCPRMSCAYAMQLCF